MSYEFIIGTIIGIAGLLLSYIGIKDQARNYFRPNMQDLLNKLASHNISSEAQKKILKEINVKLKYFGKGISNEYIENFKPKRNAKSNIFLDICIENTIEPTTEICKSFLGYDSPDTREKWKTARTKAKTQITESETTIDMRNITTTINTPNTVYISSLLKIKYPKATNELLSILKKHNIKVKELCNTKDIWCRDYMPVQNRLGELIQFKYNPSYLKGKKEWEESISNVREVCKANGINPIYSEINIDGGNVVLYGQKAILTDRIFSENPKYDKNQLISELESLLKAKVIIIPSINTDVTGHADGMIRFVDEQTILGNDLNLEYKYVGKGINKVCAENGLKYINVPFFEPKKEPTHEMNAIGIYVNYLEVGNLIVLPKFIVEGNKDAETEKLFRTIFPDRIIETIDYNEVALEGGLLNCTTWTIRE